MTAIAQPGATVYARDVRDPLAPVLALGNRELPIGVAVGLVGALIIHGLAVYQMVTAMFEIASFARTVQLVVMERQLASVDIEVPEKPEPPPPPPVEEEKKEEEVKPPEPKAEEQKAGEAPPPAPAEAGKVLAQEPDPNEPVDLTGDGFLTGNSDRYAGGTTASSGTSKTAVRDVKAKPGGTEGGKGTKPGATGSGTGAKDGSRPATPTSRSWNCGFPPEADFDQIDYATVMISVTVGTDGRAKSVSVLSDPGHGFGRLAKSCAMRMTYNVGVDKDGVAVVKTTSPFPVRFTR